MVYAIFGMTILLFLLVIVALAILDNTVCKVHKLPTWVIKLFRNWTLINIAFTILIFIYWIWS